VTRVLGTALLWAAFDEEAKDSIPLQLLGRIHAAYERNKVVLHGTLEEDENPVARILVEVYEVEGILMVTDMGVEEGEQDMQQGRQNEDNRRGGDIISLRREIHELKTTVGAVKTQQDQMKMDSNQNFKQVFRHLNRIESQPGRRTRVADDDGAPADQDHLPEHHARLARCPKTLHLLWDEWTNGINGSKAARTFTARERGRVKHVFSKRKIFWDKVSKLVRSGGHGIVCN
jgi:hypothetical protein